MVNTFFYFLQTFPILTANTVKECYNNDSIQTMIINDTIKGVLMIRIAFGQIQVQPGQPQNNYQSMLQAIAYAKAVNTDILIFPELCISGYLVGDLWDQTSFVKDCLYYGEELVKATKDSNLSIVFGNVAIDHQLQNQDGSLRKYNALYVAAHGKLLYNESQPYPFTIKTLLPSYRYFNEPRYFTSATTVSEEKQIPLTVVNQPVSIPTRHGTFTIAPTICEDSWDTHYNHCPTATMMSASKEQGIPVNLIVNCSASPFSMKKQEQRHQLFSQQAAEYHTPIAYVNAVGIQNNGKNICLFDGCSTLYDVQGSIVEDTPAFEDTVRPVLLKDTLWSPPDNTKESTNVPLETASEGHHFSQIHHIPTLYKALQYGIRQFLKQTGIQRIVIGASGGIDSAVNAALYSTIIPPDHLYLVNMPSRYNSDMTKDLAYQLAKNIGCHYGVAPIEDGVTATIQQLESTPFDLLSDTTIHTPDEAPSTIVTNRSTLTLSTLGKENIQARDRSSRILAGIASAVNGAFTCNGNKTEFTIGYATMYGDLAGFLAATGDLWKQDVYALAQYMNEEIFKREVIPQGSIEVVPSAELSSAQDITQGMGDPLQYEYHDRLFRSFVEGIPVDRNDISPNRTRLTPEEILHAYASDTLDVLLDLPKPIHHYFPNAASFIADIERWWKSYNGLAVAKRIQAPPILLVSERGFGNDLCESQMKVYFSRQYEELKHKLLA